VGARRNRGSRTPGSWSCDLWPAHGGIHDFGDEDAGALPEHGGEQPPSSFSLRNRHGHGSIEPCHAKPCSGLIRPTVTQWSNSRGGMWLARALATLVLTRNDIGEPEFSSIEEWLGVNTDEYYAALDQTGR